MKIILVPLKYILFLKTCGSSSLMYNLFLKIGFKIECMKARFWCSNYAFPQSRPPADKYKPSQVWQAERERFAAEEVKERGVLPACIITNPGWAELGIFFNHILSITFPPPMPKGVICKGKHMKMEKNLFSIKDINDFWKRLLKHYTWLVQQISKIISKFRNIYR